MPSGLLVSSSDFSHFLGKNFMNAKSNTSGRFITTLDLLEQYIYNNKINNSIILSDPLKNHISNI